MLRFRELEDQIISNQNCNIGSSGSRVNRFNTKVGINRLVCIIKKTGVNNRKIYNNARTLKQSSVVKFSYSVNKYEQQWKAHGKYLMRKKAAQEELAFNKSDEGLDLSNQIGLWQKANDEVLYKIIISPENGNKLDMKEHVRDLMKGMERDLRREVEWMGIVHVNTEHKHAHVVLRSIDKKGKKFGLSNEYRTKGLRLRSQELATKKIGFRNKKEILVSRQKVIHKNHITAIDRDIERIKNKKGFIRLNYRAKAVFQYKKNLQIEQRLDYLVDKGLAQKVERGLYTIKDNFLSVIKKEQVKHDIIKSLQTYKNNMIDKDLPFEHKYLEVKDYVIGRIAGVGISNDVKDLRYIILEGVDGKAYRLDLYGKMLKERDKLSLRNGDILYMEKRMFEKDGKEIKYTHFQNFKNLESLTYSREINELDRDFIEKYKSRSKEIQISENTPKLQKAYIDHMIKRIHFLINDRVIDKDLNEITRSRGLRLERKLE